MTTPSPSARVGTPKYMDHSDHAPLSEKDRMLAGLPYLGTDACLTLERAECQKLCRELNKCEVDEGAKRTEILKKLLHPGCKNFDKIYMEPPFQLDCGYNFKVGENFYANFNCVILDSALIEIGDNVTLAPGVQIYTARHPLDPQHRVAGPKYYDLASPVKVGSNCWIGGHAIICPGVTVGDNVVIGAGTVVNRDVPDNVVVAGNPGRIIRYLDGAVLPAEVLKKAEQVK